MIGGKWGQFGKMVVIEVIGLKWRAMEYLRKEVDWGKLSHLVNNLTRVIRVNDATLGKWDNLDKQGKWVNM